MNVLVSLPVQQITIRRLIFLERMTQSHAYYCCKSHLCKLIRVNSKFTLYLVQQKWFTTSQSYEVPQLRVCILIAQEKLPIVTAKVK